MKELYECAFCHHIHEAKKGCAMVCCPICLKAMDKTEKEKELIRELAESNMEYMRA